MSLGIERLAFSPEELRRVEEVDRLTAAGDPGIEGLLAMLDDPSWTVRRAVVAALAGAGMAAFPALYALLRNRRDSETRVAATVDALAALVGDADAALVEMTAEADEPVLADIAQILGRRRTIVGLSALVRLTRHRNDNVAVAALEALGRVGGRVAVESLVQAVQSRNFFRVFPAIDVLGRTGDPRAVAPLTALLDEPQYAAEAARALGRSGDVAAVGALVRLIERPAGATVRVGALALADLHHRHQQRFGNDDAVELAVSRERSNGTAIRQLSRALSEGDPAERAAMCFVLGMFGDASATPALTPLLDSVAEVAEAAASALRRLGPKAEDQVLRGIREGDASQRRALLPLVSSAIGAREAAACLADADPDVRALACEAMARLGVTAMVGAIFPLLADPNPRVSYAAMAAIQSLGSRETERLALAAARSTDPLVRRAAVRILAYFGSPAALDDLLAALSDSDEKVREGAIQGLSLLDDPRALEALLVAARDASERTRAAAMRSLGHSSGDLRVTAYLLKGLGDPDAWVRYYACQALGRLGYEPAREAVILLLGDPAGQVRVAAVEALSNLKSEQALEALRRAVVDADGDIQRAALIGLGVAQRAEVLPLMFAAASSPDPATRLVAVSAFAAIRSPDVLDALVRAASDEDEAVRGAAIGFIAAIPGLGGTQALSDLLRTAIRTEPVLAALSVHVDGRVPGIIAALESADDETASALTSALVRLRRRDATAALFEVMRKPQVAARKAAAAALGGLGGKEAWAALKAAADHDPEPEVRQICSLLIAR